MTITTAPDLTSMPPTPDRVDVTPYHLSITETYASGSSHNIHLLESGDLAVVLAKGQESEPGQMADPGQVPFTHVQGHIVIALEVDDDHDEVFYGIRGGDFDAEEALARAIETLQACRSALSRIRRA